MTMRFAQFHAAARRVLPDFERLHVGQHPIDPRAATSIVIAGMALAMALMVTMTLTEPVRRAPATSIGQVAPPPASDKVTIVATTPRLDVPNLNVPCAEQTWPYIDRRCLTETTQKRPEPKGRREAAPAPAAAETQAAVSREVPAKAQVEAQVEARTEAQAEEPQPVIDTSEAAELAEDDDIPHPLPALSEREMQQLERMERRRAAQERRMRQPHLHLPLFGRIF